MKIGDKVRENYARRWAGRLGLFLGKSRARKFNIDDWGGYRIKNLSQNLIMAGEKFDLKIEDVERFLSDFEKKLVT